MGAGVGSHNIEGSINQVNAGNIDSNIDSQNSMKTNNSMMLRSQNKQVNAINPRMQRDEGNNNDSLNLTDENDTINAKVSDLSNVDLVADNKLNDIKSEAGTASKSSKYNEIFSQFIDNLVDSSGKVNQSQLSKLRLAIQNGRINAEEIQYIRSMITENGLTELYEAEMKTMDFGKYLKAIRGAPPLNMIEPHAHHILYKEGNGVLQKTKVEEGHAILREYGIDPIIGIENLIWAPNRVAGQHGIDVLINLVDTLKNIKALGGNKSDIIKALNKFGRLAAERR